MVADIKANTTITNAQFFFQLNPLLVLFYPMISRSELSTSFDAKQLFFSFDISKLCLWPNLG